MVSHVLHLDLAMLVPGPCRRKNDICSCLLTEVLGVSHARTHGLALQGCGKTIEMLALILSNPAPAKGASADRLIRSRWDALLKN